MPHLQFETSASIDAQERQRFAEWVTQLYSRVMDTGTGHVAVTIRMYDRSSLRLGRMAADGEPVAFVNADIRQGRSAQQRRTLAERLMDEMHQRWGVPRDGMYVIFTEHPGEDFHLTEGPLGGWGAGEEDPTS